LKQLLSGKTLRFGDGAEGGPFRIRLAERTATWSRTSLCAHGGLTGVPQVSLPGATVEGLRCRSCSRAVRVPLDEWDAAAKAAHTGFARTAYWDSALGALCIGPNVTAVAYDTGGMTNAARVWLILQYYGLKAVILNGGWPALSSATGLPPAPTTSAGGFRPVPGSGPVGLVDRVTLRLRLDGRSCRSLRPVHHP
jgi:hypothetical protein